jgi:hypothetical protein
LPPDDDLYRYFVRKFGPPDEVAAAYVGEAAASVTTAVIKIGPPTNSTTSSAGRPWRVASIAVAAIIAVGVWFVVAESHHDRARADVLMEPIWAGRVVSFTPGKPHSVRSNVAAAVLGPADYRPDRPEDDQVNTYLTLGRGGTVVIEFANGLLRDAVGPDLRIVEVGHLNEPMDVAVSRDGDRWIEVGRTRGADSLIDLASFVQPTDRFRYVRLIDAKGVTAKDNEWPGADVDAVCALHVAANE